MKKKEPDEEGDQEDIENRRKGTMKRNDDEDHVIDIFAFCLNLPFFVIKYPCLNCDVLCSKSHLPLSLYQTLRSHYYFPP